MCSIYMYIYTTIRNILLSLCLTRIFNILVLWFQFQFHPQCFLLKSAQKVGKFKISIVPFWSWRKFVNFMQCDVVKRCSSEMVSPHSFNVAVYQLLCEQWLSKCPNWQTLICKLLISVRLSSLSQITDTLPSSILADQWCSVMYITEFM